MLERLWRMNVIKYWINFRRLEDQTAISVGFKSMEAGLQYKDELIQTDAVINVTGSFEPTYSNQILRS